MGIQNERKSFSKILECMDMPNFVEIQTDSYANFLQMSRSVRKRKRQGLEAAFQDCFPIESFDGSCKLEYVGYELGKPKYPIVEKLADVLYRFATKVKDTKEPKLIHSKYRYKNQKCIKPI